MPCLVNLVDNYTALSPLINLFKWDCQCTRYRLHPPHETLNYNHRLGGSLVLNNVGTNDNEQNQKFVNNPIPTTRMSSSLVLDIVDDNKI